MLWTPCPSAPSLLGTVWLQVVRLAVEAQALSALLLLLAQAQQVAADSQDPSAALKWPDFEAMMGVALRALQGQLHSLPGHAPGAASAAASQEQPLAGPAAAAAGAVAAAAAEQEGEEAPPLPDDVGMADAPAQGTAGAAGAAGSRPGTAGSSEEEEEEEGELPAEPPLPSAPLAAAVPIGPPLPEAAPAEAAAAAAAAHVGEQYAYPLPFGSAPLPPAEPAPVPAPAGASGAAAAAVAAEQPGKKRKPGVAGEPASKKARAGAVVAAPVAAAGSHAKLGKGTASLINKWQKVAKQVCTLLLLGGLAFSSLPLSRGLGDMQHAGLGFMLSMLPSSPVNLQPALPLLSICLPRRRRHKRRRRQRRQLKQWRILKHVQLPWRRSGCAWGGCTQLHMCAHDCPCRMRVLCGGECAAKRGLLGQMWACGLAGHAWPSACLVCAMPYSFR